MNKSKELLLSVYRWGTMVLYLWKSYKALGELQYTLDDRCGSSYFFILQCNFANRCCNLHSYYNFVLLLHFSALVLHESCTPILANYNWVFFSSVLLISFFLSLQIAVLKVFCGVYKTGQFRWSSVPWLRQFHDCAGLITRSGQTRYHCRPWTRQTGFRCWPCESLFRRACWSC